jgi:hypothetical protein
LILTCWGCWRCWGFTEMKPVFLLTQNTSC